MGDCSAKGRHEGEARAWWRLPAFSTPSSGAFGGRFVNAKDRLAVTYWVGGGCLLSAPRQAGSSAVLRERQRAA